MLIDLMRTWPLSSNYSVCCQHSDVAASKAKHVAALQETPPNSLVSCVSLLVTPASCAGDWTLAYYLIHRVYPILQPCLYLRHPSYMK